MSNNTDSNKTDNSSSPVTTPLPLGRGWGIGRELKDYALISLGVILYALGVTAFMLPYGLTTGGVAGIASIVYYATGLEVQVTYIAINVCFLIAAIKVLGLRFCLKTIYAVFFMTFVLWLLQRIIEVPDPENVGKMILPKLIGEESFMACVLGAIICGIGLTFCFENNGSTGGTDIIAAIVNKYKPMSLGSVIMACDVVIISSCYFIFHDWARVIYGFVMLFICSMTLDYCIRRQHQSVQFMIFSRNYEALADEIVKNGAGVTMLSGEGWYTHTDRNVIICIARKSQRTMVQRLIKRVDPYAFVSMCEANSVWGEGFDHIKVSDKIQDKKKILVCATNNIVKIEEAQRLLGEKYDIRSLHQIGCDTRKKAYSTIFDLSPEDRVAFVKRYFGFDTFYTSSDGPVLYVEGSYELPKYDIQKFEDMNIFKSNLEHKKK